MFYGTSTSTERRWRNSCTVKWITDCYWTGFTRRTLGVLLSVKEFLAQNQKKTLFKDNVHRNRWFQAVHRHHHQLSALTSESLTSSIPTLGEADYQKMAHKMFIFVYLLGSHCFPTQHFFLLSYKFQHVEDAIKEGTTFDILQDPARIFTGDESSFQFC